MPLDEADLKYLWDMLHAAREGVVFIAGLSEHEYLASAITRRAMERTIEIVGEAARHVSEAGRAAVPDLEWGAIVATRHILAHEYGAVDHAQVWRIASVHLPELIACIEPVIEANPPGPEAAQDPGEA